MSVDYEKRLTDVAEAYDLGEEVPIGYLDFVGDKFSIIWCSTTGMLAYIADDDCGWRIRHPSENK